MSNRLPNIMPLAFLFSLMLLICVPNALAAENEGLVLPHDSPVNSKSSTKKTLSQISLYADLWHAANIKDEVKKATEFSQTLHTIIRSDIDASSRMVRKLARQTALSRIGKNRLRNESDSASISDSTRHSSPDAFTSRLSILRKKVKLYERIKKERQSSTTLGLLSDYMNLLRKQIGYEKIWLSSTVSGNSLSQSQ